MSRSLCRRVEPVYKGLRGQGMVCASNQRQWLKNREEEEEETEEVEPIIQATTPRLGRAGGFWQQLEAPRLIGYV